MFRIFYSPLAIKLEITKRKKFYMWYFNLNPSHINTYGGRIGITLTNLTPPHCCACSKLVTGYPMSYVFFVFSELMWEMVVRFVDIGGIVDHHSSNVLFINLNCWIFSLLINVIPETCCRTKFSIYIFIKERKILTCNHSPVNFSMLFKSNHLAIKF